MPVKTKPNEMQRLRAAGFSLANAERMAQDKKGPSLFLVICLLVGLFLLGGILVLVVSQFLTADMPMQVQTASLMHSIEEAIR